MASITLNGHQYSTAGEGGRDFRGGGWREWNIAFASDILAEVDGAQGIADEVAALAAGVASVAAGWSGTSTNTIDLATIFAAETVAFTSSIGKQWITGTDAVLFRTSDRTKRAYLQIASYNPANGATVADVKQIEGVGSFSDWTLTLSGEKGEAGPIEIAGAPANVSIDPVTDLLVIYSDANSRNERVTFADLPFAVPLEIFSSDTVGRQAVSSMEQILIREQVVGGTAAVEVANDILFGNISVAATTIYTSADAETWTARTMPSSSGWGGFAYGASIYVATGSGDKAASSPTLATWTARTLPSSDTWTRPVFGDGAFVTVSLSAGANKAARSTDGITWTGVTNAVAAQRLSFIPGADVFVATAASTAYEYSTDAGATWTADTLPFTPNNNDRHFLDPTTGRLYVHEAGTQNLWYTTDGVAWTQSAIALPDTNNTFRMALLGDVYLLSQNGRLYTTTDMVRWARRQEIAVGGLAANSVAIGVGTVGSLNSVDLTVKGLFL